MKKLLYIVPVLVVFGLASNAYAANNGTGAQTGGQVQQQDRIQDPTTHMDVSPSPSGNQVKNQNQVSTQNQGEETHLQVATSEMEQLMDMGMANKNLETQVQSVAKEQAQAQTEIQSQVDKLESRSNLSKKLFGPDYKAIKNLNQQMEQNRLRIQTLVEFKNQVTNQSDETQIQEAIQALTDLNTKLQEQVEIEESIGSLFGWFVKLFYR